MTDKQCIFVENKNMAEYNYSSELQDWADKTVKKCKPIAENYYLDYYAFQKPCNLKFKTLILALNPYSNCPFPTKKIDEIKESTLTSEKLLLGNSSWNGYKTNWKVYKQLMKMKMIYEMNNEFNFMNYVYFPSKKFTDIQKNKEVDILYICKNLTLEFLHLLNPKNIILLGTSSGLDQFDNNGEVLLEQNSKRLIIKGKIDQYNVFAIPHPSWLNDDELLAIDINLREILQGKTQSKFDFKKPANLLSKNEVEQKLKELNPNTSSGKFTDITLKGLGNDEIFIRINYKDKVVGLRNTNKNNFYILEHSDYYKSFFKSITNENSNSWILEKKFPTHFFATNEDIYQDILDLYKGITDKK
ncbi:MAG: hypothetical protein QM564_00770 [Bergeyella sp.]